MRFKGLPRSSVFVQFIGVLLLVLVLPFSALLVLTTNRLSVTEKESANQYLSSNLRTVSANVDQALRNLEFSHTNIFQDTQFLNGIKRLAPYDIREEYSDFRNTTSIKKRIGEVAVINDYIYSIYAYSFPANRIFSSKVNWNPAFNHFPGDSDDWLQTYLSYKLEHPWYITRDIATDRVILSSYREVWVYGNESPIGLLSVNVEAASITRMLDEITPSMSGYSFIMDGRGNAISNQSSGDDAVFKQITSQLPVGMSEGYFDFKLDSRKMFASVYTSPYSDFKYIVATPMDQIQTSVPVMIQLIALFLLLLVLSVILSLFLAHHYFFTPVTALFAGMKGVQDGDFSVRLPQNPTYEFGYINKNFNSMAENIQKLITENYTSQLVNKEAQIRNMRNQLNEHFLYNTLDSIHWLARLENAPQVCDMVFALASFYRLSLSSGKDVIPVRDVINMLKNYLYIQKFRMRDALDYSISCEPEVENEPILKSLLQPIIENAIVHGFKSLDRPGMIEISFARVGACLRAAVKDNGGGFTEEGLRQVREQLALPDPYREHSFALKTIQSQLQIFYGTNISLNIETARGVGSTVWFDMPLSHWEEEPPC